MNMNEWFFVIALVISKVGDECIFLPSFNV